MSDSFSRSAEAARFSLNGAFDPIERRLLEQLSANASDMSRQWMQQLLDPRRDIEAECGFPPINDNVSVDVFRQLYERDAVAARVVQVLPKESWQIQPLIYEDEDSETTTDFEDAWDELGRNLQPSKSWHKEEHGSVVWEHLLRADILSGIGQFGIILLGIDDGRNLQDPVEGVILVPEGHPALGTTSQHADGTSASATQQGKSSKGPGQPQESFPRPMPWVQPAGDAYLPSGQQGKNGDSNKQQSAFPQRGESDNVMEADQPLPKGGNRAPPDSPGIRVGGLGKTGSKRQTRNFNFKEEVKKAGKHFAKCGRAMPGYGQIFWKPETAELWYVGGDGDEDGFHKFVEAKLGMLVGGPNKVTYEAESFPPRDGSWQQLYPEDRRHVKILNAKPDSFMTEEEERLMLDPAPREVWNGRFNKDGSPEMITVNPPPPNEEEKRAIENWRREREETITWNQVRNANPEGHNQYSVKRVDAGHYQVVHPTGEHFIVTKVSKEDSGADRHHWNVSEQNGPTIHHYGHPFDSASTASDAIEIAKGAEATKDNWKHRKDATRNTKDHPQRFDGGPGGPNRVGSPIGGIDTQYAYDGGQIPGAFGGYAQSKPGMALPPGSTLSGTDQQYFGVQFGPSEQLDQGTRKKHRLLFLRCFDESLVQIVRYEWNVNNPRFGMPVMYRVTLNDPRQTVSGVGLPLATVYVHWSRVVHIADNRGSSEVFGYPRMRQVLNNLLSLRKMYGASPEGYWKSCFTKLSFETHPQLGGDVLVDHERMQRLFDRIQNTLQQAWVAEGMSVKSIGPEVTDPTPHIDKQLEAICILIACPKRVFVGSERGELASAQDDSKWNDVIRHRQMFHLTPNLIVPFIDRLICLGILPEPKDEDGYKVEWPDLDSTSKKDKGAIALSFAQAITAFVSGGCEALMTPFDFFVRVMGLDEEVAKEIIEAAIGAHEDSETMSIPAKIEGHDVEPPEGSAAAQDRGDQQDQAEEKSKQFAAALKAKTQGGGDDEENPADPSSKQTSKSQALKQDPTENVEEEDDLISNMWSDVAREAAVAARKASRLANAATIKVAHVKAWGGTGEKAAKTAAEYHQTAVDAHEAYLKEHFNSAHQTGKLGTREESSVYSKHADKISTHKRMVEHHLANNSDDLQVLNLLSEESIDVETEATSEPLIIDVAGNLLTDNDKQRSNFFTDCERDEHGWCKEGEGRVPADHLERVQSLARKKVEEAPVPTEEEKADALARIAEVGANKYRRGTVGNSSDRAKRRDKLLEEFGDGKECPCVYCGLKITHGTLQQDKIYTSDEGGKYRLNNLVPACSSCNNRRGDTAWSNIKWGKKAKGGES